MCIAHIPFFLWSSKTMSPLFTKLRHHLLTLGLLLLALSISAPAFAQYNKSAGVSSAPAKRKVRVDKKDADTGKVITTYEDQAVERDAYGNASSSDYDLAIDGAFEGQTIVVLQLYTLESNFDFEAPRAALKKKGFSIYRFKGAAPSPEELEKALKKANQFWLIADSKRHLNEEHLAVIKKFFDEGHGIYIWGDNQPYYADANYVAEALFGANMNGNLMGDKTITLRQGKATSGILPDHLLSTGIEYIYEGITIATIQPNETLTPLIWGSAGNLVASFYDKQGKRAILDGGFTRLYIKWDSAGTGRYITNAAAWLANYERFGDEIVAKEQRDDDKSEKPDEKVKEEEKTKKRRGFLGRKKG